MAFLFSDLAGETHGDAGEFLRRHAQALAAGTWPYDEDPPTP